MASKLSSTSKSLRVCITEGCFNKMWAKNYDGHDRCVTCRGQDCLSVRCDECMVWGDAKYKGWKRLVLYREKDNQRRKFARRRLRQSKDHDISISDTDSSSKGEMVSGDEGEFSGGLQLQGDMGVSNPQNVQFVVSEVSKSNENVGFSVVTTEVVVAGNTDSSISGVSVCMQGEKNVAQLEGSLVPSSPSHEFAGFPSVERDPPLPPK